MRIKLHNEIFEVSRIEVESDRLIFQARWGTKFLNTGKETLKISEQILKDGYADLTPWDKGR